MAVSVKTQVMLWGKASGRCSICQVDLFHDESQTDDPTHIGEICHIIAESDNWPRADLSVPIEKRNSYSNLILLCRNHHKIIDAQENEYTVERLKAIKSNHEKWVAEQLDLDQSKQNDEIVYADIIDEWERLSHIDNWDGWSGSVLATGGQPMLSVVVNEDLYELRKLLFNRVWPGRYPELENAFQNFRLVLQDFQETFHLHSKRQSENKYITEKFYKIQDWDEELYWKRAREYDFHANKVEDLFLELTRAGNLVCDRIRQFILTSYRLKEGRLFVVSCPDMDLKYQNILVQYSNSEKLLTLPYPGLQNFLRERENRDFCFGQGTEPAIPQRE